MKAFTLNLKDFFELDTPSNPTLSCYLLDPNKETDPNRKHPSVLVIPGGGYGMVSQREGEPIALHYATLGFNTFVLDYSVAPVRYPEQLLEASAAMTLIRRNSEEWFTDVDKIAVIGFSAGGHLAGCLATIWDEDGIAEKLGIEKDYNRPNAAILCYPVLTSDDRYWHHGSFTNLLGENENEENLSRLSIEKRVTDKTPPVFLWHTASDDCVPVMNSILMAKALSENKIPFELHIFPSGGHGLANCNITTAISKDAHWQINPHCERWVEMSKKWLTDMCNF